MQTRSLVHVPMAIKAPFRGRCDKKVIFQVAIGARNGRIYLEMRQKGAKDQEFIRSKEIVRSLSNLREHRCISPKSMTLSP